MKGKQDDVLDKDKTMNNVQERNICTNVPSSQTFRSYFLYYILTLQLQAISKLVSRNFNKEIFYNVKIGEVMINE
jgi:hypothetical protein